MTIAWHKNRLRDLLAMSREQVEAIAAQCGIRLGKSKAATVRAIEKREFTNLRTANKLPLIQGIF